MPIFDPTGPILLDIDSAVAPVSAAINVVPDGAVIPAEVLGVIRVEHTLPAPFVVTVDQALKRVEVSAPSVASLFPAELIRYRAGNTIAEVASFGALPPNADHVLAFRPSPVAQVVYTLDVFVPVENAPEALVSYTVTVESNLDGGRAALLAAIAEYG